MRKFALDASEDASGTDLAEAIASFLSGGPAPPAPAEELRPLAAAPSEEAPVALRFEVSGDAAIVVELPVEAMGGLASAKGGGSGGGGTGGGGGGTVLTTYKSGSASVADSAEYNVEIQFKGSWTTTLQQAFIDAANLVSSWIKGDVLDVTLVGVGKPRPVDDIVISAEVATIDGVGAVLGQAGPTALRSGSLLPVSATMKFDVADAQAMVDKGFWAGVVLHEMLHCLGIGSLWGQKGLVDTSVAGTAFYTGANGNAWFQALRDALWPAASGDRAPVETDGGEGTRLSHWDEETFGNELMTGYVNGVVPVISNMSIGSLADLGYSLASEYVLA